MATLVTNLVLSQLLSSCRKEAPANEAHFHSTEGGHPSKDATASVISMTSLDHTIGLPILPFEVDWPVWAVDQILKRAKDFWV